MKMGGIGVAVFKNLSLGGGRGGEGILDWIRYRVLLLEIIEDKMECLIEIYIFDLKISAAKENHGTELNVDCGIHAVLAVPRNIGSAVPRNV